ncbi:MAG: MerR family transcriptional regulator, partial [Actinomycetota bacterium]
MTIDELARRGETTTRNVRAYQTRGLLPPPHVVGRVGYYNEGHLARLKYIARLQQRGLSLAAIRDLLAAWEQGRSLGDVLDFEGELTAPWTEEQPEVMSRERLEELFPESIEDPGLLQRSIDLGLIIPEGDDFKVVSPRQIQVGAELVAAGVPLSAVLDEHQKLAANLEVIAERFVALFEKYVW